VSGAHVLGGLVAAGAGVFAYASLIERNAFTVREVSVEVLPHGSTPVRVLHLSDLHLAPWQKRKIGWIRSLADAHPDLIVATGDSLGHDGAVPAVREALSAFAGIPGVFVHGSNDYFGPHLPNPFTYLWRPSTIDTSRSPLDTAGLEAVYSDLGWLNLNNSASELTLNGSRVLFAGTDDPHLHLDKLSDVTTAVESVIESSTEPVDAFIGVTHAPYRRVLDSLTTLGTDVIFAGHTHGGQVCVPFVGALTTNSDLPARFARGLSTWNHGGRTSRLNVSAGIGTSIFAPVRFACPPEAVLVTLLPRPIG
jgi:predicted MPP superfamily phosphohydrolase